MSGVVKRVAAGMGANAFAQALTIGIQLASLPIFLRYWDIARYGLWLMISAVPSYFSMADIGMITAAGNKMTMAHGRGDSAEANRVFQSALLFMLISCGALALITVPAVLTLPLQSLHGLDQRLALCALVLSVLITLFGSLSAVAIGGLCARLAGLAVLIRLSADGKSDIKSHFACAQWKEVRAMTKPAVFFMLFPLSNALSFQGMTLLAGYELGPILLVPFNTYRTLARIAVPVTGVLSLSLQPEFSLFFGKAGPEGVVTMYRRAALLGIILTASLSTCLYFTGPLLLKLWTHGKIGFDPPPMLLMLAYAAVAGAWYVPRMLLISTNEHSQVAFWSLTIAAASLVVAAALCRRWGLDGLVTAMLLSEIAIAGISVRLAEQVLFVPQL